MCESHQAPPPASAVFPSPCPSSPRPNARDRHVWSAKYRADHPGSQDLTSRSARLIVGGSRTPSPGQPATTQKIRPTGSSRRSCSSPAQRRERQDSLTRGRLSWVAQNYLRAGTLAAGNARLVNYHATLSLAQAWGGGEVASADGVRFVVPVRTINAGPNPRYFGAGRGVTSSTTPPISSAASTASSSPAPCGTASTSSTVCSSRRPASGQPRS